MPSTFLSLHYHLVFSTKHREPFIKPELLPRLHENQEEHHRHRSFREELEIMLKRAGVEYDPRYLD